jgi:hypothetical protein
MMRFYVLHLHIKNWTRVCWRRQFLEVLCMIVFCTKCWIETDSSRQQCPRCGADLAVDSRSYEEKLISSLDHPLPQARARACWLIGVKQMESGVTKLMSLVQKDADLFVRRAAVQALGRLRSTEAVALLESLIGKSDLWMEAEARKSLHRIKGRLNESK